MIRRKSLVLGIASLGLASGLGYAIRAAASGIPSTNALSYAGVLEDSNGPINGSHDIQVIFYDAATAGNNLCQSITAARSITDGHFSVQLPDACTTAVGANPNVWADVLVDGSDTGRTKIGAVPYAVEAKHTSNADIATNAAVAAYAADAGHASSADKATSANTATLAQTASALAAGPIGTGLTVFSMDGAVNAPCAIASGYAAVVDCTCPSGTFIVSGGGAANQGVGQFLRESRPTSATTWRVTCSSTTADVLCYSYNLTCSRLGP
jgi:hypothetical protein